MVTPQLLEKNIEDILAKHHSYFIEPGLQLKDRQVSFRGGRADLLFIDRFGDELLIEIKRGTLKREAVAQLLDYLGNLTGDDTRTRLMFIAGSIAANWKMALDRQGIEYREYTEKDYLLFLEKYDPNLLRQIITPINTTSTPPIEPPRMPPSNLCGSLKDFFALRNFKAGEGITEKSVEQWLQERRRAKEKYRLIFHPDNLEKMSSYDFKSFLYFKNNRCWTQLYRSSLGLINDMGALRKAIAHLQDETLPVEARLRDVLHGGSYWIDGFGINIATGILHICDEGDRYGVWNNRTDDALSKLGYLNQRVYNRGKDYLVINGCLHCLRVDLKECKPELDVDLGLVDSFIWFISKDKLDYL